MYFPKIYTLLEVFLTENENFQTKIFLSIVGHQTFGWLRQVEAGSEHQKCVIEQEKGTSFTFDFIKNAFETTTTCFEVRSKEHTFVHSLNHTLPSYDL